MGRAPIPAVIKRRLIPVWNEAHRLGWLAFDHAAATMTGGWETCAVCGQFRPMLYRRRVIPERLAELWSLSPRLRAALARKESCDCAGCGAKLRARRMAQVLLCNFPTTRTSTARSLADWARSQRARELRIAEINRIDGLHEQLAGLPNFFASDYSPGAKSGAIVNGVRSEDLVSLTYPDESFDLVLTSETLEHVSDLSAALASIHRVLAPGGLHIFTIPLLPNVPRTFARSIVSDEGRIVHRSLPICHPGGDSGYPVFTEFGADLPELLQRAGFAVEIEFGPTTDDDLAQVYVCRKLDVRRPDTNSE